MSYQNENKSSWKKNSNKKRVTANSDCPEKTLGIGADGMSASFSVTGFRQRRTLSTLKTSVSTASPSSWSSRSASFSSPSPSSPSAASPSSSFPSLTVSSAATPDHCWTSCYLAASGLAAAVGTGDWGVSSPRHLQWYLNERNGELGSDVMPHLLALSVIRVLRVRFFLWRTTTQNGGALSDLGTWERI